MAWTNRPHSACILTHAYAFMGVSWEKWEFQAKWRDEKCKECLIMYSGALLFCCEDFLTLKSRCNSDWSFDAYIAETSRNHGTSVGRTNLAHVCHFKSNLHLLFFYLFLTISFSLNPSRCSCLLHYWFSFSWTSPSFVFWSGVEWLPITDQ